MAALPRMAGRWTIAAASLAAALLIAGTACGVARHIGAGTAWAGTNAIFWGLAALTLPHIAFGRLAAVLAARGHTSNMQRCAAPVTRALGCA
jgi:hypothetical protein